MLTTKLTIGQKIKELRKQQKMQLVWLAYYAQINQTTLRLYESGHRQPGIDNLRRISNALKVTLGAFHDCKPFTPKRPRTRRKKKVSIV